LLVNIKHNYHVHKYDTRCSHDPHVSVCTSFYQNIVLNMGIKSYNKLPEKTEITHTSLHTHSS